MGYLRREHRLIERKFNKRIVLLLKITPKSTSIDLFFPGAQGQVAPTWMGVLMAARSACPLAAEYFSCDWMSGRCRRRPKMVFTYPDPRAKTLVSFCVVDEGFVG